MVTDTAAYTLAVPPLFAALAPARDVLIAGAGGGFDVYAGLPLALAHFSVDLPRLAARCLYLDRIENTIGRRQVVTRIEAFRDELRATRIPRAYPH
ncbi:hypothetical protein CSH63_11305 [Micromonospora tulbaghiae]|uniref:DUF1152 domain-containing protein n=1 Tax=Micromonospora tulbaghiae TaxID=479978 RepID=A0A386WIR2_9ACTN|nr:hypothetical protein CSH63_11305 [Micromonospora tulbaghiae]